MQATRDTTGEHGQRKAVHEAESPARNPPSRIRRGETAEQSSPPPGERSSSGETARALVVEDEALVRDVLTSQLKIMGFEVDTAVDGLDGLQKYMHGHYDLVITDLVMPSMNGLDLVTHIKQVDEDAVILVLTAYPTIDTAAEAIRRGASDYIAKPFLFDDLEHRISKAIDEKVMRRQVTNVLRLVWQLVILIPLAILVGLAVAMLFR